MTRGFGKGGSPRQGTMSQRDLLERMKVVIDQASARGAGIGRDNAKAALRELLRVEHWDTEFIRYNLGVKRCRYLRSLGYPISNRHLFASEDDVERITAWEERER
jgi:hypothetical protein